MLQNFASNVIRNRPKTPNFNAFTTFAANKIPQRNPYFAFTKPSKRNIGIQVSSEKRTITTSSLSRKPDETDKSNGRKNSDKDKKPGTSSASEHQPETPPWPPYGPSPSCCEPCAPPCEPPPPRNPNPYYNYPPPCIRTPPPPWCSAQKEVPPLCPASITVPLPPVSFIKDIVTLPESQLEKNSWDEKKEFVLDKKYEFDVFDAMQGVLYDEENANEFYQDLRHYFEPQYKNLEYFSFNENSYYDMGVHLGKFYSFASDTVSKKGDDGKKGKEQCG